LKEILTENGVSISGKKRFTIGCCYQNKELWRKVWLGRLQRWDRAFVAFKFKSFQFDINVCIKNFWTCHQNHEMFKKTQILRKKKYFEEATKSIFAWGFLTVYSWNVRYYSDSFCIVLAPFKSDLRFKQKTTFRTKNMTLM
jgi:hypothetical protein